MADKGKKDKPQEEESQHTPLHTPPPSTSVPERTILRTALNPEAGHQHSGASISIDVDTDGIEIDIEERPSDTESIRQLRQRRRRFEELRRDHYNRMYYDNGSIIRGSQCLNPELAVEIENDNENEGDVEKQEKPEEKDKSKK